MKIGAWFIEADFTGPSHSQQVATLKGWRYCRRSGMRLKSIQATRIYGKTST
jgi:hypothetical protein